MEGAGRLVRVLSEAVAADDSCFESSCAVTPTFSVITPRGVVKTCEAHLEPLVESIPEDFIRAHKAEAEDVYGVPV